MLILGDFCGRQHRSFAVQVKQRILVTKTWKDLSSGD